MQATAALLIRLNDPDREVRTSVADALAVRPGTEVAAALLSGLDHPDPGVRQAVVQFCTRRQWRRQDAVTALRTVLAGLRRLPDGRLDSTVTVTAKLATLAWSTLHPSERRVIRRDLAELTQSTLRLTSSRPDDEKCGHRQAGP